MRYGKPALSVEQQIDLLVQRGLVVPDRTQAGQLLGHINYYRLRGYWLPFEQPPTGGEHRFRAGTRFDDVLSLYVFDRQLRLLLLDIIERVEVSVRTQWAHQLAMQHGPHAYLNTALFQDQAKYRRCLDALKEEIDRSHETFVEHYRITYSDPPLPPIWAACEVMSLGQLSKWIQNLRLRGHRQAIAAVYDLDESVLCSFLHHLSHVRNLCAHHSRVWNRRFTFTMKIPTRPLTLRPAFNPQADRRLYNSLVMLSHLVSTISPQSAWRRHLLDLFADHPQARPEYMGFPTDWRALTPWMVES